MDISLFEYIFPIAIVWKIMHLHQTKWKPDMYIPNDILIWFTKKMSQAAGKIWSQNKALVDEIFHVVRAEGSITLLNFDDGAKFMLHLLVQSEYNASVFLNFCVVVSSYAACFYKAGVRDAPTRAMEFMCDSITNLKQSDKFTFHSWVILQSYCEEFVSCDTNVNNPTICSIRSIDPTSICQCTRTQSIVNTGKSDASTIDVPGRVLKKIYCTNGNFNIRECTSSNSFVKDTRVTKCELSPENRFSKSSVAKKITQETCAAKEICIEGSYFEKKPSKASDSQIKSTKSLGKAMRIENSIGQVRLSKFWSGRKMSRTFSPRFCANCVKEKPNLSKHLI